MTMPTTQRAARLATLLLALPWSGNAWAELKVETQSSDQGELTVFKMTVTPAAEPVPALKHRLVLRELEEKTGNAAPMYYRAFAASEDLNQQFRAKFGQEYPDEYPWPNEAWPSEKLRDAAEIISSSPVLTHLREAASRQSCDWGFELQSIRGPNLYSFLLPEIQEARNVGRHLTLLMRVAVNEGRYDDAVEDLRINLKLARDTGNEPLLVCGLVGIAIAGVGERATIDLIAAPDSPNLYWALTELPDPLIDLREALRFEMNGAFRVFPFMLDAETQEHSADEWARLLAEGIKGLDPLTGGENHFWNETAARLGVTALALASYTPAKQRLVASGLDAGRVEAMPVGQVLAIDAGHEYRRIADEFEKRWYLSYRQSIDQATKFVDPLGPTKFERGYGGILAAILLPATVAARTAEVRLQWQTGALRTVEAIRMHAAETGKLPASLDDIKTVPVPENPATGKEYQYRLDGDTAVLELPFSDGFPGLAWRFEIQLAK